MKTSITLTLVGAACAMLVSCGTSSRETIYVTSETGEPICGARLTPYTIPTGCTNLVLTNPCGVATLPGDDTYCVEKHGFRTVEGIKRTGASQHVVMVPGWPN